MPSPIALSHNTCDPSPKGSNRRNESSRRVWLGRLPPSKRRSRINGYSLGNSLWERRVATLLSFKYLGTRRNSRPRRSIIANLSRVVKRRCRFSSLLQQRRGRSDGGRRLCGAAMCRALASLARRTSALEAAIRLTRPRFANRSLTKRIKTNTKLSSE